MMQVEEQEGGGRYGLSAWAFLFEEPEVRRPQIRWMLRAKCFNSGMSDIFVPAVGSPTSAADRAYARAICNGQDGAPPCPVREACAEYAVAHRLTRGVWGGLTSRQIKLRVKRAESAARRRT